MGAYIVRQPNGKLARFSSVVDCVTHFDMTEEEYIDYYCEKARKEAKDIINHLYPFDNIIDDFRPMNETWENFIKLLKEMGANEKQIEYAYKRKEETKYMFDDGEEN